MKETRKLNRDNLRRLCIEKNWYTYGTNAEYENILSYADSRENVETSDIAVIAEDILNHSKTEYPLESICFEIARICYSFFEQEEGITA